jgi:coronin-1B/1C/6
MPIVRFSKFRHVFGTAAKPEDQYSDIKVTRTSWDSNFCAVNPKFVAIVVEGAGGGPFLVLPLEKTGRVGTNSSNFHVDGHTSPVLDLAWSPFNDNVIASASEDCTVKIWAIPNEGLSEPLREEAVKLVQHEKRALLVSWHPTAEHVLASAGADNMIFLWKVDSAEILVSIDCHSDLPLSISWNLNGSLFATTCKDKTLRVINPRNGKVIAEKEKAHEGNKSSKCIFLKTGKVFTLGFSKRCDRQYALWDPKSMDKALTHEEIDQAAGVLFPFYDAESDIIYVAGKGDTSIRYFEVNDDEPYVHYLNMYQSQNSQRGLGFMPKRGCDSNKNEIARFFKLSSNKCEPVSFTVPRKAETFQKDLYPPCISSTPALSAEEWFSGKDKNPIMMQMTAESGDGSTDRDFVKSNTRISTILSSSANTSRPISQVSTNGNGVLAAALPEGLNIEELLEDIKKLKATVRKQGRRIAKLEAQLEEKAA